VLPVLAGPLRIPLGTVAAYVVPAEDGIALVDTGYPGSEDTIIAALAEHGLRPSDIRVIVITHGHADHIGGLAALAQRSGAPVLAHEAEAHVLASGDPPAVKGLTTLGRLAAAAATPYLRRMRVTPYAEALGIAKERSLADLGVEGMLIPTPGHTPGSLSLVMDGGDAFVGDLCSRLLPFGSPLPPFGSDRETIAAGWRRVLTAGARTIYPGHGRPFPAEDLRNELERFEGGESGTSPLRVAVFVGLGIVAGMLTRRFLRRV
jgi:glyoxylase-like metal-dependent hydrolase (beta-lactamase superfamily II)